MERGIRTGGPKPIRSDTHTLLTIVASHPLPWRDEKTGEALFDKPENRRLLEKWQQLNIKCAKKKAKQLGFELVSVVRHDDEGHPHLHFIGIPSNRRLEARACHPGYVAREALKRTEGEGDKEFRGRRDRVYKAAMRSFQDDYYEAVSIDAGLVRTGPKRRRVPGRVWHEEKAGARARGLAAVRADQLAEENERTQRELEENKEMVATIEQEAVDAIIMVSDLKRAVQQKSAQALALDDRLAGGDVLLAEREAEEAALQRAKEERSRLEAQNGRTRANAEDLRLQIERFGEEKREFAKVKKVSEDELAEERRKVDAERKTLSALTDGVIAYAQGKLTYRPQDPVHPFNLKAAPDGSDDELKARLQAEKPQLLPMIQQLDRALSDRAVKMQRAITEAVAGWSSGLLEGVGEPGEDGRPTFLIPATPKGDKLLKTIEPFRELVAKVVSSLPDRGIIASVKDLLSRLHPRLANAEQEEARSLEEKLKRLAEQRAAER